MWVIAAVLGDQHHALGAERQQQVVHLEAVERVGQGVLVLQVHRGAEGRFQLPPVGLEHGGAGVFEELAELGVHHDRDAAPAGAAHGRVDQLRRQRALVVVLQQQRVGVGQWLHAACR